MLSLRLFPPILTGEGAAVSLSDVNWRRSIRGRGGYWLGDFSLVGPENDLAKIFYEYLGGHFEERSNGKKTWEGMIYEMDLTYKPAGDLVITRRRSLDMLYNYVYGKYTDTNGSTGTLAVAKNDQSITRYGRKEEYLLINGMKAPAANARRDAYLKEHAWPWARVVGIRPMPDQGQAVLDGMVAGYIMTANWRYRTAGNGSDGNVSDYIKELITTDCATYLLTGNIQANTLQVTKGANNPMRSGDMIINLTEIGDASGNPWWLYVHNDRHVHYEMIPTAPRYYMHSGKIFESAGGTIEVDPWTVKPGVFRDLTYPVGKTELGSWLTDARDFYVSEVEVGTGNGLVLKTELYEESEIMAAQAEYQAQMGSGGESNNVNWWENYARVNKIDTSTYTGKWEAKNQWTAMSIEQRRKWKETVWKAYREKRKKKK